MKQAKEEHSKGGARLTEMQLSLVRVERSICQCKAAVKLARACERRQSFS